jgi:prophage antirepressor-like protein
MFLEMNTDNEKLIELLRADNVRITNKGNICLNDFVRNIVESKNPELYMKRLRGYDKILINNEYYVTPDTCIGILKNTNFKKCKNIYTQIQYEDNDGISIIDVENEIFQFEGHKFMAFFVKNDEEGDWNVWIKGVEVAKFLLYEDDKQAIRDHVDIDNKKTFLELSKLFPSVLETIPKSIDKKTNFINLSGFCNLIHGSQKPLAKKIKKWLDNDVIPALIKYGTYTMQPKKIQIEHFYDRTTFSQYDKMAVIYIAFIGKYKGEYLFKFGLSRDMFRREYKEHRKQFEQFKVVFIGKCDNCEFVEDLFKKELKLRHLHRELVINNKTQTELFTITTKHTYKSMIELMKDIIDNNALPEIKEANNKITNLTNVVDTYKQSEELRKLELQYHMSKNYKLELKTHQLELKTHQLELKTRRVEAYNSRMVREIDLQIEQEKLKQLMVQHNYDFKRLNNGLNGRNNQHVYKL